MASIGDISDMLDAKLRNFSAKLGLGDGKSVILPKTERRLQDLTSSVVVPYAALRGLANNVVGMGTTPSQDADIRTG
jgi:hypothetical protein